ncbi:MAG: sulfur transferase domain-containing protein [Pseudomonadales bacterium]|nr:sulfur transferase domain-containing protein [Pseudomonadales bacterium]
MEITKITDQYTVSGQITVEDLDQLVEQGVELLICNRPDNEAEGQPNFLSIESRAKELGIQTANIPFVGGQLTKEHVDLFKEEIGKGLRTHAYCRTGNRCTIIWKESQS